MRAFVSCTAAVLLTLGAAGCQQGEGPTAPPRLRPVAPSFHIAGPCNAGEDPGHSEFAKHHVAPMAQAGMLGAGGHIPGSHRGFSACNPSENRP
jgi:hypothetical protein